MRLVVKGRWSQAPLLLLILLASEVLANKQIGGGLTLFSEEMTNFAATEGFTFVVQFQELHKLSFLFDSHHTHFRGFFFVETTPELGSGEGLTVDVEGNGQILETFVGQKLGVFNFEKPSDSMISLNFKAEVTQLRVSLNYELKKQDSPSNEAFNLNESIQRFDRALTVTEEQLKMINHQIQWASKTAQSIEIGILTTKWRIILETLAIVCSGFVWMLAITTKLREGYQLV